MKNTMKTMTLEDVQSNHRKMYKWIAEKEKEQHHYVARGSYFRQESKENVEMFNFDFCCDYAYKAIMLLGLENKKATTKEYNSGTFGDEFCKTFCPCTWDADETCYNNVLVKEYDSLRVTDWERLSELAEEISELPFKDTFNITAEDAKKLRDAGFGEIYSAYERREEDESES